MGIKIIYNHKFIVQYKYYECITIFIMNIYQGVSGKTCQVQVLIKFQDVSEIYFLCFSLLVFIF